MTARFMSGTPYAALEIEMQRPPGFRPRKSGMIISRCACGTQECDCSLCAHKERNGTDQTAKRCACLCEQILAGCTPLSKLMGDLTTESRLRPVWHACRKIFLRSFSWPDIRNGLTVYWMERAILQIRMCYTQHCICCRQIAFCGESPFRQSSRMRSILKKFRSMGLIWEAMYSFIPPRICIRGHSTSACRN